MRDRRKFSIFISSTYEDLKEERQALVGVALENNFIPVGMEQFHAAPTSQWNVITKNNKINCRRLRINNLVYIKLSVKL